jgi:hypothetical protein
MANVFTVEGGDLLTTNGPGKRNGCNTQFSICETSYIYPFFFLKIRKKQREIESNGTLMDSLNKRIKDDTIKWITFFLFLYIFILWLVG